ncbi:MAG TPA: hypothetical protein VD965_10635 [Burkholderiales bacterium]|nr:hypothetical protein [Burkholderiales bacterium]
MFLLAPVAALAQQQVVRPPIAQYWMSVETSAGMSMPGMGSVLGAVMGAPAQGGRRMHLQLGSQQVASGAPRAEHAIPSGMNMGPSLPLITPQRPKAERGERADGMPGQMEKPKGRMLIYWGCGENVRPGQPVVIDFAKVAEGQTPPNMVSRRVNVPASPAPGRHKTYGDWPNPEDSKNVPDNASLRGEHNVRGNYSPDIRFSLGEAHDFMPRVDLKSSGSRLNWNAIPHATGYFAMLYGGQGQDEVVFWSSSEVQEMGGTLMDYVPPAEVARLVKEKVVLPSATTDCTVPGEVVQRAGGTPFINFIAYGPEANFVHPPRPSDPKVPWEQQWVAKARFKSTASLILGQQEASPRERAEQTEKPAADNPVEQGIKALRGIFGR